mgnify:CR=1 FL=1
MAFIISDKQYKEFRKLLNRIKKANSAEHAKKMIAIFDYYTNKGKNCWDWSKPQWSEQRMPEAVKELIKIL